MADAPLASDDPRMVAWEQYKQTESYQNSRRWLVGAMSPTQGEGEQWDAFLAGFTAASQSPAPVKKVTRETIAQAIHDMHNVVLAEPSVPVCREDYRIADAILSLLNAEGSSVEAAPETRMKPCEVGNHPVRHVYIGTISIKHEVERLQRMMESLQRSVEAITFESLNPSVNVAASPSGAAEEHSNGRV